MPYKGSLEVWYVSHQNLWSYFCLIGLTASVVLFPRSDLVWRLFKDLPAPSEDLDPWM